jgi:hypothetical protein
MREWWCTTCKGWVSYDPREVVKEQSQREHARWCGLDVFLFQRHPDLVRLDQVLTAMYPVED